MKKSSASKINLSSYDDLFGKAPDLKDCVEVDLSLLYDFENHPFQVNDDEDMAELVASIKDRGILEPGIVRPRPDGGYEVIAGHRRKHAAALAGLSNFSFIGLALIIVLFEILTKGLLLYGISVRRV